MSTGLDTNPVMPAWTAASESSLKELAVMAMMGMELPAGSALARIRLVASRPSITGMRISIRIT